MPRDKKPDDFARENAVSPSEPFGTQRTEIGTVKWWRDAKGYGVIAVESLRPWDVWCHFSHVEGEGFRTLTAGERVEVEYVRWDQESFKYRAVRVRRLETPRPDD